jgi:GNAT superfamily N-acetyltransferase
VNFEPVIREDLECIRSLQPDGWPDITAEFSTYIHHEFCRPVKVVVNDIIAGVGASISYKNTGWLAHIIVDPTYRHQGIGSAVTSELARVLEEEGKQTLLLIATDLGYPVYLHAGFTVVSEYTYLKRESPWTSLIPSPRIIPFEPRFRDAVLELDRKISGEDRSAVIELCLNNAQLYVEQGSLLGFYLPAAGEGSILARTETAGIELMKIKYARADKAVLPSQNRAGIEFLKANGFVNSGTRGIRMIRGEPVPWQPEKIFSRIGGNFG